MSPKASETARDGFVSPEAASFRDPAGVLAPVDGRMIRIVKPSGLADLNAFLRSAAGRRFMQAGQVVRTEVLDGVEVRKLLKNSEIGALYDGAAGQVLVEHERILFPSYPYEWPAEMLHAAGALTLRLARELLAEGLGLKDATPYNVLFRGPEPVFVDVLSFERRDPDDPAWLPYAQFVRTFLLPLMAQKYFGIALDQVLSTRRDGLEPEEVYRWTGPLQKLRPPFLTLVSMPTWLAARHDQNDVSLYCKRSAGNTEKARFILESLLKRLERTLGRLAPRPGARSAWSGYMQGNNNYSAEDFRAKHAFVEQVLAEFAPKRVLDVGSNTGHFSALAARRGASVVAIDHDPVVLGQLWREASGDGLDILPLVVSLTRPTPGIGWRNRECASFLDRARGSFDAVFMLAVIHHMLVTERVPLEEILNLAAELTRDLLVIEFIGPEDSMFRRIARGREELHKDLTVELFEDACRQRFEIVRRRQLERAPRRLYLLRKRAEARR